MNSLLVTARALHADRLAVELISSFAANGVPAVLLKGAAIATWLYDDGAPRPYGDVDLLVPHDRLGVAEDLLRGAGFDRFYAGTSRREEAPWASAWRRDEAVVDLHHTLWGVAAKPQRAWTVLTADSDALAIGCGQVPVLALPARALHVALHAAQHGTREAKPIRDLVRCADRVSLDTWHQAARLARELAAEGAMAAGLRLAPETAHLPVVLGLPQRAPVAVTLHATGGPTPAIGILQAVRATGWRAKVATAARRLVPTPAMMRTRYPIAVRGRPGLAAAYLVRWWSLAGQAPGAFAAISRARWRRRSR